MNIRIYLHVSKPIHLHSKQRICEQKPFSQELQSSTGAANLVGSWAENNLGPTQEEIICIPIKYVHIYKYNYRRKFRS